MSKILKLPNVIERTALSRSSIYAFIQKRCFPAPIILGKKAVGWLESEIAEWIDQKAKDREHKQ